MLVVFGKSTPGVTPRAFTTWTPAPSASEAAISARIIGDQLYSRVGFVFQDVQLVHGTVRDNIALPKPAAGIAQVEAAAVDAQIHKRIMRLPNGYDTVLGRRRAALRR